MPDDAATVLHAVAEWQIGPKADFPSVILILRHLPFEKIAEGATLIETAVLLTPAQAMLLAADLQKNASLFPASPTGPTH